MKICLPAAFRPAGIGRNGDGRGHSGDSVLAITGGTGEFAGATGDMLLSARGTDGKAY